MLLNSYEVVTLGDVCHFVGGGTPARDQPEFYSGDIPWATVKDFKSSTIIDTKEHVTQEAVDRSASNIVEPGTVLLVTRVGLGKVAMAGHRLAINQDIKGLTPRGGVLPEYLFWFLVGAAPTIERMGVGATVKGVTLQDVKSIKMPLPKEADQRRIVDLLSRAENIIQMRQAAEQKAKEIIPALFLDMFGDPGTNPMGWEVARIEDCCTLVRGSSPRPQGDPRYFCGPVPRLMIADITRDGIYVTPRIDSLTPVGAERSRPMNCGDVVMAVSGACGLPAILAVDACIHDGFVGFRSLSERIRAEYLYTFLAVIREETEKQAVGATFQNLKTDQIRAWKVPIPPIRIQDSFVERAKSLRRLGDDMARASRYSESVFQSLLARMFGEAE